ncbi:MAG: restriction endonuclease [Pseudomonas sp.]|jgi:type I restriction enzyme S subunit|uniref:restriction endonuclease subunit S n=1 Tax=Stutzerimonas kunmingensis TaxID=1211807 RepID=UPI0005B525D1|nr:restriction endonuclease subunit S [Stutzerimonas kunmingensis]MAF88705.1 restriction endonuclease [Pseudomonas sp.]MAK87400.1 restriction endonuclease [Pseudomonas sp.]HAG79045.1 restriction endonuclease [Pseudomonas sp.]HCH76030.1 restriction endonuclease [Pseudomonas sp.]|tara:strand:+ start:19530 stop:20729 length:1200 start_codon:yes stop_codon:yes gene_type:complete
MIERDLKPGWRRVKFGDVVRQCKEKADPETSGLERYIAGDHMDTDDLRLRRWGEIGSGYLGPAFHMRFKPGQVLYGSRRTYLRKVAVADFEGICANTTFVLETKNPDELLPEFLPFLMQTEAFNAFSVKNSKGSVNPYINFSDLARFEFGLPPKDEQHRLVKLLTSIEGCLASLSEADLATTALENSRIEDALASVPADRVITVDKLVPLGPKNGLSPKANADERGYPTLSIGAVRDGRIVAEGNTKYAEISDAEAAAFELKANDVLVVRGNGNKLLTGRCGLVDVVPKGCFYPDLLIRLKFDEKIIRPEFAVLQWNSQSTHNRLISRAKSTNGIWKINGADIRQHALKVPEVEEQDDLLAEMRAIRSARKNIATRMTTAQNLKLHALRSIENGGGNGI